MRKRSFLIAAITIAGFMIFSSIIVASFSNSTVESTDLEWRLKVSGLVNHSLNLTIADLQAMPQTSVQATIYCVDYPTQVVTSGNWTGVQLKVLLEQAGVQPSAVKVALNASDGYTTDLDLQDATSENVIVAYEKDGRPLSETLRLVVPGRWGYKWISQLTNICVVDYDFKGKWESLGYSDSADISSQTILPMYPPPTISPQPNTTTTTPPSASPQPSNASTGLPAQGAKSTSESEPEPQTSMLLPIAFVAPIIAVLTFASLLLLTLWKKRRSKPPVTTGNPTKK